MAESNGESVTNFQLQFRQAGEVEEEHVRRRTNTPKHPKYALLEEREKTFRNWDNVSALSSAKLAEAGFLYTGVEDVTMCFHCGKCLRKWSEHDDPVKEHASHSGECEFLKGTFGLQNIKRTSRTSQEMEEDMKAWRQEQSEDSAADDNQQRFRELEVLLLEERERRMEAEEFLRQRVAIFEREQAARDTEKRLLVETILHQKGIIEKYEASFATWRKTAQDAVTKSEEYKLKNMAMKASVRDRVRQENDPATNPEMSSADPAAMATQLAMLKAQVDVYKEDFDQERSRRLQAEDRLAAAQQQLQTGTQAPQAQTPQAQAQQQLQTRQEEDRRMAAMRYDLAEKGLTEEEVAHAMARMAQQALVDSGYTEENVAHAFAEFTERHGHSNCKAGSLCAIIEGIYNPGNDEADEGMEMAAGGEIS